MELLCKYQQIPNMHEALYKALWTLWGECRDLGVFHSSVEQWH